MILAMFNGDFFAAYWEHYYYASQSMERTILTYNGEFKNLADLWICGDLTLEGPRICCISEFQFEGVLPPPETTFDILSRLQL